MMNNLHFQSNRAEANGLRTIETLAFDHGQLPDAAGPLQVLAKAARRCDAVFGALRGSRRRISAPASHDKLIVRRLRAPAKSLH
jgi:hypothetical protein